MQRSRRNTILALLSAVCFVLAFSELTAAEGAVTVRVQGVLATNNTAHVADSVPESLKAYAEVLKRFPFGKFQDIGSGSGTLQVGQTTAMKVGSHVVEVTLLEIGPNASKIKYTIKDSAGAALGSNAMVLAPGQIVPIQVGDPAFPVILFFQAN